MYSSGYKLIKVRWFSHFWLLKNTHFVWLKALNANNLINNFSVSPNIVWYYVFSLNIYGC